MVQRRFTLFKIHNRCSQAVDLSLSDLLCFELARGFCSPCLMLLSCPSQSLRLFSFLGLLFFDEAGRVNADSSDRFLDDQRQL